MQGGEVRKGGTEAGKGGQGGNEWFSLNIDRADVYRPRGIFRMNATSNP